MVVVVVKESSARRVGDAKMLPQINVAAKKLPSKTTSDFIFSITSLSGCYCYYNDSTSGIKKSIDETGVGIKIKSL